MKRIDPALDVAKRNAAARAVEAVENKMVLGLGSGSTASMAIELIGQRVAQGLDVSGIPTSERTAALARFMDHVLAHDRVWIARREEIARHWMKVHPSHEV